jgi:hypothetical protein
MTTSIQAEQELNKHIPWDYCDNCNKVVLGNPSYKDGEYDGNKCPECNSKTIKIDLSEAFKLWRTGEEIEDLKNEVKYWKAKHDVTANMLLKELEGYRNQNPGIN